MALWSAGSHASSRVNSAAGTTSRTISLASYVIVDRALSPEVCQPLRAGKMKDPAKEKEQLVKKENQEDMISSKIREESVSPRGSDKLRQ